MHEQLWSHDAIDFWWGVAADGETDWLSLSTAAEASGVPVPDLLRAAGDGQIRWRLLAQEAGGVLQLCAQDLVGAPPAPVDLS